MQELVQDDRLHLRVTQEVVDAGEELEDWGGGEPDPRAYDRVTSTTRRSRRATSCSTAAT